ncbi:MAG: aldolase/citrate lyase family protein [bacterium]
MTQDLQGYFVAGGRAVNGWCALPSAITAEIMGRQGFDLMTVDLQHGLIDYQLALTMLQVLQGLPAPVLARVPWNEPGILMKCLDAGFSGVICPMVNTVADAHALVHATRYAPLGNRSFGPTRANMIHGPGYVKTANTSVLVIAMIETREAMTNLDAILAVQGIDGVYVGPSDLGLSLGHEPTLDPTAPEVLDAIATIAARAKAAGRLAGVHTGSAAMVRRAFAQGYDFASLLTDARIFTNAVAAQLAAVRDTKQTK